MHPVIHFLVQGCGLNCTPVHALRFTIDGCNSDLGGWLISTIATINVHGLGWATRIVINPVRACHSSSVNTGSWFQASHTAPPHSLDIMTGVAWAVTAKPARGTKLPATKPAFKTS